MGRLGLRTLVFWGGASWCLVWGVQGYPGWEFADLHSHADLTLYFGRGFHVGLAGVVFGQLPRDGTLDSCSFVVDCKRSTGGRVDLPSSMVMPFDIDSGRDVLQGFGIHWGLLGGPLGA